MECSPYGVGADSISARAIWGNAKPHGRALFAPTMHFFDSLRLPFEGSSRAAGEGWPGCHEFPPTSPPIKTTKRKTEECLRHSSIFLFIFCAAHSDRIGCNRATNLRKLTVQNAQKRQKMCKTAGIKKKCTTFNTKNVVANLLNSTLRPFTQ